MLILIALLAALILVGCIASVVLHPGERTGAIIAIVVCAVLGAGAGLTAGVLHATTPESSRDYEVVRTIELASLANASEVEGEGSFIYHRVGEKNVYRYVVAHDDGTFTFDEMDADGVPIREDATPSTARIETVSCTFKDSTLALLLSNCGGITTIHIPEGSITNVYEVDPSN